jgi:vanadium chloroperoxidase
MNDSILFWNEIALEANRVSHTDGSTEQKRTDAQFTSLGYCSLSDVRRLCWCRKDQNLPPYLPGLPKPEAGASAKAAVAAAAHATLSNLFPSQGGFFDSILAGVGDTSNPGHNFGLIVAQKILEDRNNDPIANAGDYKPSLARGKHRVDPDNPDQGFDAPFYGARSKGFAITKRHELEKPPFDNENIYKL